MRTIKGYKHKVNNKLKVFGKTDFDKRTISINKKKAKKSPARGELLDSIVHEHTHARHPRMAEKTVRKVTATMLPTLSRKQKKKYYAKYQ